MYQMVVDVNGEQLVSPLITKLDICRAINYTISSNSDDITIGVLDQILNQFESVILAREKNVGSAVITQLYGQIDEINLQLHRLAQ
jgi:hypothetical protein